MTDINKIQLTGTIASKVKTLKTFNLTTFDLFVETEHMKTTFPVSIPCVQDDLKKGDRVKLKKAYVETVPYDADTIYALLVVAQSVEILRKGSL